MIGFEAPTWSLFYIQNKLIKNDRNLLPKNKNYWQKEKGSIYILSCYKAAELKVATYEECCFLCDFATLRETKSAVVFARGEASQSILTGLIKLLHDKMNDHISLNLIILLFFTSYSLKRSDSKAVKKVIGLTVWNIGFSK